MWFAASLFFKSHHPSRLENESLWELSIVLVEAASEHQAGEVAQNIGHAKQHEYTAIDGDLVQWTFERIERVHEILEDEPKSGTEVYSCFLRESEVKSLLTPFED